MITKGDTSQATAGGKKTYRYDYAFYVFRHGHDNKADGAICRFIDVDHTGGAS